jgi:hypothetical protein
MASFASGSAHTPLTTNLRKHFLERLFVMALLRSGIQSPTCRAKHLRLISPQSSAIS